MQMTRFKKRWMVFLGALIFLSGFGANGLAWNEHPLITYPVAAAMPEVRDAAPVAVESLDAFIRAEEKKLERLLAEEEAWARKNLQWYAPLPDALAFKATGNAADSRVRFCHAIRINPNAYFPLDLQLVPGEEAKPEQRMPITEITFLKDVADWNRTTFVRLKAGDRVKPLDVVAGASDEPDLLGIDIGLFEDNNTAFGKMYGFGKQPFGDPKLEYGSQAPFHMGFYHESDVMYFFAGFLKKTYPEYRIHLYKTLARFAFETGHPYWGWRFTGWGLHYLADMAQPYHATVLPGVSTSYAIWFNTIDMIGIHGPKNDAVQLVSNRHAALEKFVQVVLQRAYGEKDRKNAVLTALQTAKERPLYSDSVPREVVSRLAHDKAEETDKHLEYYLPDQFVSDSKFEFGNYADRDKILERTRAEKGQAAVDKLTADAATLLAPFAPYGQGYVRAIIDQAPQAKKTASP